MKKNIKLTVAYDGTNYHGFQLQPNAVTVQEKLETAINKIYRPEDIRVYSASRTDSRVHARGQVINFFTERNIPIAKVPHAINSELPNDIVITSAEHVSLNFRARGHARLKRYRYYIYHSSIMNPFWRNYTLHYRDNYLNYEKMQHAAKYFEGKHDFTPFKAIQGADPDIDPIKEIHSCQLEVLEDEPILVFEVLGDGFLYKMVRIMVGTLLEVGREKITCDDITQILRTQDRTKVGPTAKPHGLYLDKIWY